MLTASDLVPLRHSLNIIYYSSRSQYITHSVTHTHTHTRPTLSLCIVFKYARFTETHLIERDSNQLQAHVIE